MKYSVVIPVYNEVDNLPLLMEEVLSTMNQTEESFEILLIDDGSVDGSFQLMKELSHKHPQIRYFKFRENRGQSAALAAGFQYATGEYVITMDSDLQNDPADILTMLPHLKEYQMVTGWRQKRNDTWIKRISSRIANGIRNSLSRENIRDTGCSLKIMKREYLSRIKMFKGMHRFLPTLMKMEGARVIEVPVSHRPRSAGESKYGTWDRAFSGLRDLLAVRWMQDRFIRYEIEEKNK